ncbi:MAG: hypothetical protein FJ086_07725 [Deltaproteobacteria bacterium]|nr:hypothetical protein [Deltaproteobacteria bacterium]
MRHLLQALALTSLTTLMLPAPVEASEGCYICQRGSTCGEQCRYGSKDTSDARKACAKKGCKVRGTKSCSTAANVKNCALPHADGAAQCASAPAGAPAPASEG